MVTWKKVSIVSTDRPHSYLDVPSGVNLSRQRLCQALESCIYASLLAHTKHRSKAIALTTLGRRVESETRPAHYASDRRHLQEPSAYNGPVHFAKELDGLARDVHRAPEVRLKHRARICLADRLDLAQYAVCGVVHDDVDAPECSPRPCERLDNLLGLVHVEWEDEQPFRRVLEGESVEGGRATRGRDDDLALLQNDLCEESSEPRRRASDCDGELSMLLRRNRARGLTEPNLRRRHCEWEGC